jgi:mitochondrial chaperone BCS1
MFELLKNMLAGHNQFATGGLLLMVIGGLGVYLRAVPERLWEWFVSQTTLMVTVKDDDAAFVWVKEWFMEQDFLARVRRVDLDTTLRGRKLKLIPAPGRHWFWHSRRPFVVSFRRNENVEARSQRRTESFTFMTIGRHQGFLRRFVADIVDSHERAVRRESSLFVFDDYWTRIPGYAPRLLESVILQTGEKECLVQDVQRFKNSKKRYRELGVPYHRGYLFYGPPGTGKTSLASALAQKFGMSIYGVNLNDFNDRTLAMAIREVPPDSVILFEDIDCMKGGKARETEVNRSAENSTAPGAKDTVSDLLGVTLSGLLNVLDGFSAPDSVLFMMTTNQVEALDPALLRPGRIDYKLYMGMASTQQKADLYRRFFPSASELDALAIVDKHPSAKTMAEFQGLLLRLDQDDVVSIEDDAEISSSDKTKKLFRVR